MTRILILLVALVAACGNPHPSGHPPDAGALGRRMNAAVATDSANTLAFNEDYGLLTGVAAVAYTGTAAASAQIPAGRYFLLCTTDCWVARGASTVVAIATVASGEFLPQNVLMPIQVTAYDLATRDYISAIRDTVSGTLRILPASRAVAR